MNKLMHRTILAVSAYAAAIFFASACGEANVELKGPSGVGGSGLGNVGGEGGEEAVPSRGNPLEFPTECFTGCVEACEKLESCGASESSLYPLELAACKDRCGLAANGPVWDDISTNFRCCASQDSCDRVRHCGGWLAHPDAEPSCDQVCSCFFSQALANLADGRVAPRGYGFANDTVLVDVGDMSLDRAALGDVSVKRTGRYAQVGFGDQAGIQTLTSLRETGRLLPTFRDGAGRLAAASGRVVIKAPTETVRATALSIVGSLGGSDARRLKLPGDLHVVTHTDPWQALDAVTALNEAGIVAELDMIRRYETRYIPNDPRFDDQWHLRNTGELDQSIGDPTSSVDARVSEAWDITLGDKEIVIGINDDGVDLEHPDFAGRLSPELAYPDDWAAQMAMGTFGGHGTSVAGVAAAGADDSVGGAGVCPQCQILPHRLGETNGVGGFQISDVEIAAGFEAQIDAGAAVINNSWGISLGNPAYSDASLPIPPIAAVVAAAFNYAETTGRGGLGTVLVFAAGNHNQELDPNSAHPNTVAVAAVGDVGLKAYYSAFGPEVTVAAPSNGGLSGITTAAANSQQTGNFGGTSSAAPLVAGVVGLILSANPDLSAAEVRTILQQASTPIDPVFGAYDSEGHSVFYGAGMINAFAAVALASGACTDAADCVAPSDDCGADCNTKQLCEICRTQRDCAEGYVCQALPSLGELICVPEQGDGCPADTTLINGYCLPTPLSCNFCSDTEKCNGRDDNCNGEVDEGNVCADGARCFIDGSGCPTGQVCAGTRCINSCNQDEDCGEGTQCKAVKDQYGTINPSIKGCVQNQAGLCQTGCSVLASSLADAELASFIECMQDGQTSCAGAFSCVQQLPVNF